MPIDPLPNGGWVATGSSIELIHLLTLRGALTLETLGMRRHGRPASVIVRELLKSKTRSKAGLLKELNAYIARRPND